MPPRSLVHRSHRDLKAHRRATRLAAEVFWITRRMAREAPSPLIHDLRACAHGIPASIGRAWAERDTPPLFCTHLGAALHASGELGLWLSAAAAAGLLSAEEHKALRTLGHQVEHSVHRLLQRHDGVPWKVAA